MSLQKHEEQILVVSRKNLFGASTPQGLIVSDVENYRDLIEEKKEFHARGLMEINPSYKQIIPYLVFAYTDKLFVMQRKTKASEQRLANKYSLGIGGHIRQDDLSGSISDWAQREFEEEVAYSGDMKIETIGLLNDETNAVGQVHLGFVYLLKGNSDQIVIKDEHASGQLMTLEQCEQIYDNMETWSQLVLDYLKSNQSLLYPACPEFIEGLSSKQVPKF